MLLQFLIFAAGLTILYYGAEWLVRGASSIAIKYGIRPLVVGLTVVALATSMPEFIVNLIAAIGGKDEMALGTIVGSNIANIALILGISALVLPLVVAPSTLKKEYPIMMGVMVMFYLVALDGVIGGLDGIILVLSLVAFLLFLVIDARRNEQSVRLEDIEGAPSPGEVVSVPRKLLLLSGGMVGLAVGARLMVGAASEIALEFGINHTVVGLTVLAIGTSLPELAASLMCVLKREADMSVGNVLGSNLMNVLFVVGLVSLFRPLHVDATALNLHFPVMLGFGVLLLPLAWTSFRITRWEGGLLFGGFVGYLFYVAAPYL